MRFPWGYRNRNPSEFPYQCNECTKQRRFRKEADMQKHKRMTTKHNTRRTHGSLIDEDYSKQIDDRNWVNTRTTYNSFAYAFRELSMRPTTPEMFSWTPENLMTNIQNKIEPSREFIDDCNRCVDKLVTYLQSTDEKRFRPKRVIKSGSLGKGTELKERSDIDLVVILRDDNTDIEKQREEAIKYLHGYMDSFPNCKITGGTRAAKALEVTSDSGNKVAVDILPTCIDIEDTTPDAIYDKMDGDDNFVQTASAGLAPLQRDFVKWVPAKTKQLIRVIKYWRKTCLQENKGHRYPTSYPLELITIGQWQHAGSPENFDMRQGLYHVMKSLENYNNLRLIWNTNYTQNRAKRAGSCIGHFVIDPANPYNNVMDRCDEEAWKDVKRQVGNFLKQPLFANFIPHGNWQL